MELFFISIKSGYVSNGAQKLYAQSK